MSDMQITKYPQDRLYHSDHTWVKFEKSNVVTFGVTFFAQEVLGQIVEVNPPIIRAKILYGLTCGVLESRKTVTDLIAPVTGVIESINKVLVLNPTLINDDPYDKGWIARIRLGSLYDLAELISASEYQKTI